MRTFLAIASVIGLLSAGIGWMAVSPADTTRPDCPGKIVCPLTGQQVCVDRCPADPTHLSAVASKAADELCGGACPAPTPKPDKPKGQADERSAATVPASLTPVTGGCCR